jgi:hypothetical protein
MRVIATSIVAIALLTLISSSNTAFGVDITTTVTTTVIAKTTCPDGATHCADALATKWVDPSKMSGTHLVHNNKVVAEPLDEQSENRNCASNGGRNVVLGTSTGGSSSVDTYDKDHPISPVLDGCGALETNEVEHEDHKESNTKDLEEELHKVESDASEPDKKDAEEEAVNAVASDPSGMLKYLHKRVSKLEQIIRKRMVLPMVEHKLEVCVSLWLCEKCYWERGWDGGAWCGMVWDTM